MPLGTDTRISLDKIGFLNIIRNCPFKFSKSYLAYNIFREIDWDALGMDALLLLYEFASGNVFEFTFAHFGSESHRMDGIGLVYYRNDFPEIGVS